MKVRIEIVEGLAEEEVVIRCGQVDDTVQRIHKFVSSQQARAPALVFYKQNQEFYFPLDEVLFFETDGDRVFAHTRADTFRIKYRLYELEQLLPRHFVRAAKSTIVNTRQVYAVTRNLAGASLVQFAGTHKQVYASRHYYGALKASIEERSQT